MGHALCPRIDPTVSSSPRDVTAARPRMMTPSPAAAPSAGLLAPQASTGQCAGLGQEAVSNNNRGRSTAASTTRQVPSTTGTITPRPVASQAVQPAYVGEVFLSLCISFSLCLYHSLPLSLSLSLSFSLSLSVSLPLSLSLSLSSPSLTPFLPLFIHPYLPSSLPPFLPSPLFDSFSHTHTHSSSSSQGELLVRV